MDDMEVGPYGCTTWGMQRPEASYFYPFRTFRRPPRIRVETVGQVVWAKLFCLKR